MPRRENHHRPPQTSLDHDRARDGRAHARATNDSSDLPGHVRIVLDAGGATGLPNGCSYTRAVQRPARSDRERLVIALAEAADDDRAVRLVADQPDVRDVEDPGDLLGDDGKEPIRRGLARDEGRDLPQGGLFGGELASALFRTLEHLDRGGLGVARGDSAEEVRLALTEWRRHGDRPVAQNDLATALGDVEWLRVRRLGAVEHVAVAVHEQIRAPRHEIAVATSQPSVLSRRASTRHCSIVLAAVVTSSRLRGCAIFQRLERSISPIVSAGHRVVHRSAGADPLVMAFVEVLEGEHLKGVVCGQRSPDPVRAVGCLAVPRALDEIHLGGTLLQPLVAHSVQDEPRRIGHDDHASRLLGQLPELLREDVGERPERMLEPALEHLRLVGLDRGQQVGRIEACGKRAPPRLDDRRSQSCRGSGWELGAERAVGEQTLPASLQLSSAPQRIRLRSDSQPLRRHGSAMIIPLDPAGLSGEQAQACERNPAAALTRHELAPKAQPVTGVSEAVASSDRHARVDHVRRTPHGGVGRLRR